MFLVFRLEPHSFWLRMTTVAIEALKLHLQSILAAFGDTNCNRIPRGASCAQTLQVSKIFSLCSVPPNPPIAMMMIVLNALTNSFVHLIQGLAGLYVLKSV